LKASLGTRPYLEKTLHKTKAGGVAQGEGPEFKPPYHQKKKKEYIEEFTQNIV
jgi:hypothetical protein